MPNPLIVAPQSPVTQELEGKVSVKLMGEDGIDYSQKITFSKTRDKGGIILDPSTKAAFSIKVPFHC
jgi:hypothetical protein